MVSFRLRILFIACVYLLGQSQKSFCQKEGHIGIFGNGVGLNFNSSPAQVFVLPNNNFSTEESSATISDRDGNLLFYTDGGTVYNRKYEVMNNGYRIADGYWSTTTQTVIVPKPNSSFLYYIFSAGYQGRDLKYSLVDMSLYGGLGGVVFKDSLIYKRTSEKLCVVKASSLNWLWVITHEYANNVFRAYRVTENGLDTVAVKSAAGEMQLYNSMGTSAAGYLRSTLSGNRLASAVNDQDGVGLLELFDFDKATGKISNAQKLFTHKDGDSYGVEFSPNETKLYHSRINDSELYQYDLTAGDLQSIINSAVKIGKIWGAVQLGPDGKIYAVRESRATYLDVINDPNAKGAACNFQQNAVYLKGRTVELGLPVFFYDVLSPEIIADNFCENEDIKFHFLHSDNVASVTWNFGDPASINNTSDLINPLHLFSNAGSYTVSANVLLKNNIKTQYSYTVIIFNKPEATLGPDVNLCAGNQLQLKVSPIFPYIQLGQYVWQDGSLNSSFTVKGEGQYWVKISDEHCTSIDTIIVHAKDKPIFDQPDIWKCKGKEVFITVDMTDTRFSWNDGFTGGSRSIIQTGKYSITAENTCGAYTDLFTVSELPELKLDLGADITLCRDAPVVLNTFSPSASYEWSDGSLDSVKTIDKPGTYWVNVFNQCSSLRDTIDIQYLKIESINIPNVITPNGDNFNEQFVIDASLNNPSISIVNRWGNLVYSSDHYKNDWQGADLSTGYYYYTIHNTCLYEEIKGWIHLLR